MFVNIYHGRASYEIGVEIGLKARSEKYGLGYIVSWAGETAWRSEGFGRSTLFQVSSRDGVQRIVPRVAEIARKYSEPFLGGDLAFTASWTKPIGLHLGSLQNAGALRML
jgi:hypothetical protein